MVRSKMAAPEANGRFVNRPYGRTTKEGRRGASRCARKKPPPLGRHGKASPSRGSLWASFAGKKHPFGCFFPETVKKLCFSH